MEEEYVRAAPGGTGFAKVGGNYAGSLKAQTRANAMGCEQVLWLDAIERSYVEEIGTSNAFFVIGDEVITAPLAGTILPGVTRDSVIELFRKWGHKVSERRLKIDDVIAAAKDGTLKEVFATGTAAVISPVGTLVYKNADVAIGDGRVGPLSDRLYETLYGIQTGPPGGRHGLDRRRLIAEAYVAYSPAEGGGIRNRAPEHTTILKTEVMK